MYSIHSERKASLFRDFMLAVLLSVVGSLLTAMPAAYAGERYALEFDGVDDYVDVPTTEYQFEDEHVFTIELWARWFDNTRSLCSFRYHLQRSQFRTRGSEDIRVRTQIQDDQWHHVAVVYDGSGDTKYLDLYVDGVHTDSANTTGSPLSTYGGDTLRFGMTHHSGGQYSNCIMDDVRIWNKGRAPSEIQEYMNRGLSGGEEGLVGYWKFDEGEGTTAYDSAPNQNHGTLVGATWTADASPVVSFVFLLAYSPDPAAGATDVPRDVVLSWTPGEFADKHDVYFGTNFNDVNDADRTNPRGVLVSQNHVPNNYSPAEVLQWEQTYYWRVDEVNSPPDFTVFEGDVWSFTTELIAYPIDFNNITATASSAHQADMGPVKTIDGSGLDPNDLHSTEETAMWLSSMEPLGAWIQYEFDNVYKVYEMWVWNSNQAVESFVGFGLNDVTIEYSTNGTDWTTLAGVTQFAQAPGTGGYAHNTTVDFGGVAAKYVRLTANSNWGGFMPQYGLSEVRFFYIPVYAREPYPDSGATDVHPDVVLSWRAGREAAQHDVYISTDEQAVIDSNAPVTVVTEASHGPLSLDLDMAYYWKINEVNLAETPTTLDGDVWNFTTAVFLVVDDFESYNDLDPTDPESNRIFLTWLDGYEVPTNGSLVGYENPPFCEQTIVHGGKQSMPLSYANTGAAAYSEAELTLSPPQDWTKYGIKGLTLRFYGDPSNAAQQLYVKLNGVKVEYDGAAENLQQSGWQMWYIDLASSGADISNVSTLSIGLERDGAAGGAGTLLIDSIRLYSRERQLVTPVEPNAAGLVGHYKLDDNASDSAGTNHGTEQGTPVYEPAGKFGQAINLDGIDYVELPTGLVDSDIGSVTLWIKTTQSSFGHMFYGSVETEGNGWGPEDELHVSVLDDGGINFFINGNPTSVGIGAGLVNNDTWTHVAATWDKSSGAKLYVNGLMVGSAVHTGNSFSLTGCLRLGRPGDSQRYYSGLLDDVRIYDRVLSADEIAGLGGVTVPYDKPF